MKKMIIGVLLLSAMFLSSCGEPENINPEQKQGQELKEAADQMGDEEIPEDGTSDEETPATGEIELVRFAPDPEWSWYSFGFESGEINTLTVIRSEEELEALFMDGSYVASGIDFAVHTLLFVSVSTPTVISDIYYAMQATDNGYIYTMRVTTGGYQAIDNEICAVIAPAILADESVAFDLDITNTNHEYTEFGLVRFTTDPEWNFEDFGFKSHEFDPEKMNMLTVIRSEEELKALFTEGSYVASGIDFDAHTLLFVPVLTMTQIARGENGGIHYELQAAENGYLYTMTVPTTMCQALDNEICAVLAPVIHQDETVSFDLILR